MYSEMCDKIYGDHLALYVYICIFKATIDFVRRNLRM